jgi:juvenile hormone diol kinase
MMLSPLQKQKLAKLFSLYDTNLNGVLTRKDFESITKRLADLKGWSSRSPQYQTLFHQYMYDWEQLKAAACSGKGEKITLEDWFQYHGGFLGMNRNMSRKSRP